MKYSLGISNFLEEISSLSQSVVFLYFFAFSPNPTAAHADPCLCQRLLDTPRPAAPRALAPRALHCWPIPAQETPKHSSVSVSVGSLGPGVHKVFLSPLIISLRVWGLILNSILPLLPSCWGFSFALWHGVSPQSRSSTAQRLLQKGLQLWLNKDLEIRDYPELSKWVLYAVGMSLMKREVVGNLTQIYKQKRRQCDHRGRNYSKMTTSQGLQAAPEAGRRKEWIL